MLFSKLFSRQTAKLFVILFGGGVGFSLKAITPVDGESAQLLFKKYCSPCHGLPSPGSHTAAEWRSVIYRMQTHRRKRGFRLLSKDEIELLVTYLDQQANIKKAITK